MNGSNETSRRSGPASDMYLHRLDAFVETVLIPERARGWRRARNPAHPGVANEPAKSADAAIGPGSAVCAGGCYEELVRWA